MNVVEPAAVDCPYCGEPIEVLVDLSIAEQEYTEDCPVCCQPMLLRVIASEDGLLQLYARREND